MTSIRNDFSSIFNIKSVIVIYIILTGGRKRRKIESCEKMVLGYFILELFNFIEPIFGEISKKTSYVKSYYFIHFFSSFFLLARHVLRFFFFEKYEKLKLGPKIPSFLDFLDFLQRGHSFIDPSSLCIRDKQDILVCLD